MGLGLGLGLGVGLGVGLALTLTLTLALTGQRGDHGGPLCELHPEAAQLRHLARAVGRAHAQAEARAVG